MTLDCPRTWDSSMTWEMDGSLDLGFASVIAYSLNRHVLFNIYSKTCMTDYAIMTQNFNNAVR
jgi:hypothetical protein